MSLLEVRNVNKSYGGRGRSSGIPVLRDVSFALEAGESLGLVGESGSGKTTLIKIVVGLERPDSGDVLYEGVERSSASRSTRRGFSKDVQLVFQDPVSSLNPRMTVRQLVEEGLVIHGLAGDRSGRTERVAEVLSLVGLDPDQMERLPSSFSGGQCQRIAIARALAVSPRVLVCDEAVSALDVSIQAQILNLLADMREQLGISLFFVAHDLAVVRYLCPRVMVMSRGTIVEEGPREQIFGDPQHEYTRALLEAVPVPTPVRR
ncbi:ABC transporter ATP-binding protein [Microtetraspora malaysiensis]|uniref:ABC transporter ATP-binding protein n=1 Tax=Microtetraspora malaysiensis TaxID=161358 RepID=UPI00082F351E|nr:ATP-binding cassette domain-containing protein [Microtetraspora malaysiensis]